MAAVVVIIGILAAIGLVTFARYRRTSRMAEATNLITSIQTEQEAYKNEKGIYASVSNTIGSYYPASAPGSFVTTWGADCTNCSGDARAWDKLGVKPSAPLMYGYATVAGVGGSQAAAHAPVAAAIHPMMARAVAPVAAIQPTEPFYMVAAQGDTDGDGIACNVMAVSGSNALVVTDEGE
jgi:type II secretory pathway pseudopilin PulG